MDLGMIVEFIQQHGYLALFLSFYVCLLGLPVPNEVLVMTGGLLSSTEYFHPVLTFSIVYVTVILNATILYVLGRTAGNRLLCKLETFEKINQNLVKASSLISHYGACAASICYLLPVVRHFVPFLIGTNRYSYRTFARYSYTSGFIWTFILFLLGRVFSTKIEVIGQNLYFIGMAILFLLVLLLLAMTMKKYLPWKSNVKIK